MFRIRISHGGNQFFHSHPRHICLADVDIFSPSKDRRKWVRTGSKMRVGWTLPSQNPPSHNFGWCGGGRIGFSDGHWEWLKYYYLYGLDLRFSIHVWWRLKGFVPQGKPYLPTVVCCKVFCEHSIFPPRANSGGRCDIGTPYWEISEAALGGWWGPSPHIG